MSYLDTDRRRAIGMAISASVISGACSALLVGFIGKQFVALEPFDLGSVLLFLVLWASCEAQSAHLANDSCLGFVPPLCKPRDACPCAATFTANEMDVPPWEFSYLNLRTAPGAGCSLSNDQAFLDHESMSLNGRAETQICLASVGSTNLDNLDVNMTDEQYDACLDIIANNAKEWFSNGHALDISRNYQSPVAVSTLDDIACLR